MIKGIPNSNNIDGAKVVIINNETNERIDSTFSNFSGNYNLSFLWTIITDNTNLDNNPVIHPNPFITSTNLEVECVEDEKCTLKVFNEHGETVLKEQSALKKGINRITIYGGKPGIHFVTLEDGLTQKTYKIIKLKGNNTPLSFKIINESDITNSYKSFALGTEVKLEFSKEGYLSGDTTFVLAISQTINAQLQQIPYLFTTTFKVFLETGETHASAGFNHTTNITWPNGDENSYSPNANGEINIEKELYPLTGLGNVLISNDTAIYNDKRELNWVILREPKQKPNRPNIAQSESSNHMANVEYETEVPLDSLDGRVINYYTIRQKAETQPGEYVPLDGEFARGLVESSGNGESGYFIDLAPYGVADSLDIVQFGFNLSTGAPMPQEKLDMAMNNLEQVIQTRYLQNGDTLMPPHRIYTITSFSVPRWQAIIARGFENLIYSTFYDGTPQNSRFWSTTYTYNGELRCIATATSILNNASG